MGKQANYTTVKLAAPEKQVPQWEAERKRLAGRLRPAEQLLCVAPAVHKSADNQRSREVWIGIVENSHRHFVFLFARSVFAPVPLCGRLREFIYCVIPVVENIKIDIGIEKCVFTWRANEKHTYQVGLHKSRLGDCFIENVHDANGTVMKVLSQCYAKACNEGFVYPQADQAGNSNVHSAVLNYYQTQVPLDLKNLPQIKSRGRRKTLRPSMVGHDEEDNLRLLFLTWNVGASMPRDDCTLGPIFDEEEAADVVVVGLQEICELSARRVLQDGEEAIFWKKWVQRDIAEVYGNKLEFLEEKHLVGLLILVFVRSSIISEVSDVRATVCPVGVGGIAGNKGAVAVRMDIHTSSFCFVNAHLAAGQEAFMERIQHYKTIVQKLAFDESAKAPNDYERQKTKALKEGSAPSDARPADEQDAHTIFKHDHIFWIGDTNSRLHDASRVGGMPIEKAIEKVQERKIGEMLANDQLLLKMKDELAFHFFVEPRILFLPSYKWRIDADEFDMRTNKHVPAWCDRVLYRNSVGDESKAAKNLSYWVHLGLRQSDHRPVYSIYTCPWEGQRLEDEDDDGGAPKGDVEGAVTVRPAQALFIDAKPDVPQEVTFTLTLRSGAAGGASGLRFNVSKVEQMPGAFRESMREGDDGQVTPEQLTRALSMSKVEGLIREEKPLEIKLTLDCKECVMFKHTVKCALQVKLGPNSGYQYFTHEHYVPVEVTFMPSIMRMPLITLQILGSTPLLSEHAESKLKAADVGPYSDKLHPKEIIRVMTWIFAQSQLLYSEASKKEWFPDPLRDNTSKGNEEVKTVQRYVETGQEFPGDNSLPVRSGMLFLLRWLAVLPMPIMNFSRIPHGCTDPEAAMRTMDQNSRTVFTCFAVLLAKLKVALCDGQASQDDEADSIAAQFESLCARFCAALSGQSGTEPKKEAKELLAVAMSQYAADAESGFLEFPPERAIATL